MSRIRREAPHPADIAIGRNLKRLRQGAGLSQGALGAAVGLSFQQIQKYESAYDRAAASRLADLAGALSRAEGRLVSLMEFFEGYDLERGRAAA